MIRVVFDTNVIISGSLWSGAPRRALLAAQGGHVRAFTSEAILEELAQVITRPKFSSRLTLSNKTPHSVIDDYLQFVEIIEPHPIPPVVLADRDDDAIIACAFTAEANCIVSGDPHLLSLEIVHNIAIVSVHVFLQQLFSDSPQQ